MVPEAPAPDYQSMLFRSSHVKFKTPRAKAPYGIEVIELTKRLARRAGSEEESICLRSVCLHSKLNL